jgi:disulfide bond formation protein DsbB
MPSRLASLRANPPALAALAIGLVAAAAIVGAWTIEAMGYIPCELCYLGRKPYYLGIALAGFTFFAALWGRAALARGGLGALALVFAIGTAIAVYHTGVELKFWPGPAECTGALTGAVSPEDFLAQLKHIKPVRCDEPALLLFGLSLAAWSMLVSLGLAGLAVWGWRRPSSDPR